MSATVAATPNPDMKWYVFNIGDYVTDTHALTLAEHGAYRCMLDLAYSTEAPLPHDPRAVCRMLGMQAGVAKLRTISKILRTYFEEIPEGYVHPVVIRYVQRVHDKAPHKAARRAGKKTRSERYREARKALFEGLRAAGCVMPWNARMHELRDVAQRMGVAIAAQQSRVNGANAQTQALGIASQDASRDDYTKGDINNHNAATVDNSTDAALEARAVESAAAVAERMRALGIEHATGNDEALRKLLRQGATLADFEAVAGEAAATGKRWDWIVYRVGYRVNLRASKR